MKILRNDRAKTFIAMMLLLLVAADMLKGQNPGGGYSSPSSGVNFPLLASSGSATAPSYAFSGQTNAGIFLDGNSLTSITNNGTEVFSCGAQAGPGPQCYLNAGILNMGVQGGSSGRLRASGSFIGVDSNGGSNTGGIAFIGGKGEHFNTQAANNDHYGACTFAATTTCSVTYTTNYTSEPSVNITPVNPSTTTFTLSSSSNSGFTITASASFTGHVNYVVGGNPN